MANKMFGSYGDGDRSNENTPGKVMDIATMTIPNRNTGLVGNM